MTEAVGGEVMRCVFDGDAYTFVSTVSVSEVMTTTNFIFVSHT